MFSEWLRNPNLRNQQRMNVYAKVIDNEEM